MSELLLPENDPENDLSGVEARTYIHMYLTYMYHQCENFPLLLSERHEIYLVRDREKDIISQKCNRCHWIRKLTRALLHRDRRIP